MENAREGEEAPVEEEAEAPEETPAEVPPAVVLEQPPLLAEPPSAPVADEAAEASPMRKDFLRRLRSSAENIERVRSTDSERTRIRTEGDLTVLSNVAPLHDVRNNSDEPRSVQEEPAPVEPVERDVLPAEDVTLSASEIVVSRASRSAPEDDGNWHWLWVLGVVATVLLVPIGLLLTRATRSSS